MSTYMIPIFPNAQNVERVMTKKAMLGGTNLGAIIVLKIVLDLGANVLKDIILLIAHNKNHQFLCKFIGNIVKQTVLTLFFIKFCFSYLKCDFEEN